MISISVVTKLIYHIKEVDYKTIYI